VTVTVTQWERRYSVTVTVGETLLRDRDRDPVGETLLRERDCVRDIVMRGETLLAAQMVCTHSASCRGHVARHLVAEYIEYLNRNQMVDSHPIVQQQTRHILYAYLTRM
jgi:hypothetical protein